MSTVQETLQESMKQMLKDNEEFYKKQQEVFDENRLRIKQAQDKFLQKSEEIQIENKDLAYIFIKLQAHRDLISEVRKFIDEKLNSDDGS